MHPSARGILIQWSVNRSPTICGSDRAKQENMPCSDIIVNAFIAQAKKKKKARFSSTLARPQPIIISGTFAVPCSIYACIDPRWSRTTQATCCVNVPIPHMGMWKDGSKAVGPSVADNPIACCSTCFLCLCVCVRPTRHDISTAERSTDLRLFEQGAC